MKLKTIISVIFCIGLLAAACNKSAATQIDTTISNPALKKVVLDIPTITCTGCWPRVEASARNVSGVIEVSFDGKNIRRVTIVYDPERTSPAAIIKFIEKNGDRAIEILE